MSGVSEEQEPSVGLVATVGVLIGVLIALVWVTAGDALAAGRPSFGVAGDTQVRAQRSDRVHDLAARATLSVVSRGCGGELVGSGVVTRGGLLVTAAHVTAGSRTAWVSAAGSSTTASPVMSSLAADVATAPLPRGWPSVSRAATDPRPGTAVVVASRARGILKVRDTVVDAYLDGTGPDDPPRAMRLDVTVTPGESGGPVLDRRGRLVGIVYASERGSGRALVIPASVLNAALAGDAVIGTC